jgi:hypothetical protein
MTMKRRFAGQFLGIFLLLPLTARADHVDRIAYADSILTACTPDTLIMDRPQTWWVGSQELRPPYIVEWGGENLLLNGVPVLRLPGPRPSVELTGSTILAFELDSLAYHAAGQVSELGARLEAMRTVYELSPLVERTDSFDDGLRVWYRNGRGVLVSPPGAPSPRRAGTVHHPAPAALTVYRTLRTTARLNQIIIFYAQGWETIAQTREAYEQLDALAEGRRIPGPISPLGLRSILGEAEP